MKNTNFSLQFYCDLNCPKNNFKEMGSRQLGVKFILSQVHQEVTYSRNNFKPPCSITSRTFGLFENFYGMFVLYKLMCWSAGYFFKISFRLFDRF